MLTKILKQSESKKNLILKFLFHNSHYENFYQSYSFLKVYHFFWNKKLSFNFFTRVFDIRFNIIPIYFHIYFSCAGQKKTRFHKQSDYLRAFCAYSSLYFSCTLKFSFTLVYLLFILLDMHTL